MEVECVGLVGGVTGEERGDIFLFSFFCLHNANLYINMLACTC